MQHDPTEFAPGQLNLLGLGHRACSFQTNITHNNPPSRLGLIEKMAFMSLFMLVGGVDEALVPPTAWN